MLLAAVVVAVLVFLRAGDPEDAVLEYQQALRTHSCGQLMSSTTENFRAGIGLETCEDLAADAVEYEAAGASFTSRIVSQETLADGSVSVRVEESWTTVGDEWRNTILYLVVEVDGEWRVDESELLGHGWW